MSYDPIHDTFVPTKDSVNESDAASEVAPSGVDDSPTKSKALSISSLVSPPRAKGSTEDSLADANDVENGELENGEDHEENGDAKGKKKKRKYANSVVPKCRHLKKADGEPFWRKDIQHDFLQCLFDDPTAVFTNEFPYCDIPTANNNPKLSFSELYIRSLVESSKCSKILKERLIKDKDLGKSVSKVCLLVNAGRMNTTINFVPEMRSTLRTYHSIPSLQADPKYGGSKPLQDTPRLKSILKAVCEGEDVVKTLDELLAHPKAKKPNTNVIQIIFLLSNWNKAIPHFDTEPLDLQSGSNSFMEFFLNSKIYPQCRAKRFLWLLYTYLETSFTAEELQRNPFGPTPPEVEYIPDELADTFDKDTDFEIEYSEQMFNSRSQYLADEEHNSTPKRGNKSKSDIAAAAAAAAAAASSEHMTDDNDNDEENVDTKKRPAVDDKKKRKSRKKNTAVAAVETESLKDELPESDNDSVASSQDEEDHKPWDYSRHNEIKQVSRVEHLAAPLGKLRHLNKKYSGSEPRRPADSISAVVLQNVVDTSKPVIKQVRTSSKASTASFNKKTTILGNWVYRYFRYKKTIGNRFLGLEWEDIRYDLMHGVESYLYQQFGRSLGTDPAQWGYDYLPVHDFNNANECNSFVLQLITYCNDWLIKRLAESEWRTRDHIVFDLENNTISQGK